MLKRVVVVGLTWGWAALALSGCGGSKPKPKVPTGSLITFIGDSPICDVLAFRPSITKLTLSPQGGGSDVAVIVSTPATAPTIPVNFADLRDSMTVLNFATVAAGTYAAATVTLSNPQLVLFDPTMSPPVRTQTVTMTTAAPKGPIATPLTITAPPSGQTQGPVSALRLDFDFLQSIGVDAMGQVTGTVTPTFEMTALTPSASGMLAELEGVRGFVERVDTVSTNTSFTGDIVVQLFGPGTTLSGAPTITVNLTGTTQLDGASGLNDLLTGSFVVVNGFVDSKGNVVANTIEVEDRENADQNKIAFIGYVLSKTTDSSGNLQFNFYVHEEDPNPGFSVPLDSVVVVNTSSSTSYQFSSAPTNFANLSFNPTAIVPGQELIVHGTFTVPPRPTPPATPPPSTVAADKIFLKLQTVQGEFSSLLQTGSDNKTGAFSLLPCETLLQGLRIVVSTNSQTAFVNVSGLSSLTPQPPLLVKGLPFFEPQAITVNGVAVPAGTLVILAEEVHQLF